MWVVVGGHVMNFLVGREPDSETSFWPIWLCVRHVITFENMVIAAWQYCKSNFYRQFTILDNCQKGSGNEVQVKST